MRMAGACDFAILLLTADDTTASRGRRKASPRDNVVFELGLFMGSLGRDRTFVVSPKGVDLKLPTDLLGLTNVMYEVDGKGTVGRRMSGIVKTLSKQIQKRGPK